MLEHVGILNFPYKFCVHLFFVGVGLVLSYKKTHLEDINVSILTLIHICPCVHVCNVNDDQFQVGMWNLIVFLRLIMARHITIIKVCVVLHCVVAPCRCGSLGALANEHMWDYTIHSYWKWGVLLGSNVDWNHVHLCPCIHGVLKCGRLQQGILGSDCNIPNDHLRSARQYVIGGSFQWWIFELGFELVLFTFRVMSISGLDLSLSLKTQFNDF
jgi:hypothetical protein